jgi:hypothetical protein
VPVPSLYPPLRSALLPVLGVIAIGGRHRGGGKPKVKPLERYELVLTW